MNFNFTINPDLHVNKKILSDIFVIRDGILRILNSKVLSIYLVGGFGRGEGGVIFENKTIKLINDYDFLIVTKNIFNNMSDRKNINQFAEEVAKKINIKQVDLQLSNWLRLLIPSKTIDRYEKKYGHYLVYGKQVPINFWGSIPLSEGAKYLYNRGNGLLINYVIIIEERYQKDQFLAEEITLNNNKAKLAMGDCLLIANSLYHYSYLKRMKRIEKIKLEFGINQPDLILSWYREALEFKLNPKIEVLKNVEKKIDEFFDILPIYNDFLWSFERFRLNDPKLWIDTYRKKGIVKYLPTFKFLAKIDLNFDKNLIKEIKQFLHKWHPEGIVKKL